MVSVVESCLHSALALEAEWAPPILPHSQEEGVGDFVSYEERDGVVLWLGRLSHDLHFRPEVYFRAANLLDSFLSLMKVRQRFLECVAATCFYIAAKLEERPEAVPSLLEALVGRYGCACSQADIQRMELLIMKKLEFRLSTVTPLDFLKMFHQVGVSQGQIALPEGLSPERHLCHMTLCLEAMVSDHRPLTFRPSLLALAVLGCDLKLLGCDWLSVVLALQMLAAIKGGDLSVCYEAVVPHYSSIALRYPLVLVAASPRTQQEDPAPYQTGCRNSASGKGLRKSMSSPVKVAA